MAADHPIPVPKGDIWSATPPPETKVVPIDQTDEVKQRSRIIHAHYTPEFHAEQQRLADQARDEFFGASCPTAGALDSRPSPPESNHYVDDGPPAFSAEQINKFLGRPSPRPLRHNPGDFRDEDAARAYLASMEAEHPGEYELLAPPVYVLGTSSELWQVVRKDEVPQGSNAGIRWT